MPCEPAVGRCGLLADPKVRSHRVPGGGERVRQVVQTALRLQSLHRVPSHIRPCTGEETLAGILQSLQPTSSQGKVLDFVVEVIAVHIEDDADVEDE